MRPETERRPLHRTGVPHATNSQVNTIPDQARIAELLGRSDERDQFLQRIRQAWSEGWLAGHQTGYDAGRRDALAEEAAQRREAAGLVSGAHPGSTHVPFDELDRRRYPPGGRKSWIRPRPDGDAA
ncbi:MAG: hypothetical protein ACLP52_29700 [Streptosporangiaceae bacterium]